VETVDKRKWTILIFSVLLIAVIIWLRPLSAPIISTPYTVEPITLDGINAGLFARYGWPREPNRVYILGVFRGGNIVHGEEVTHKINAEELVELLTEVRRSRVSPGGGGSRDDTWPWSIYLHQNGDDIHIILADGGNDIVIRPVRTFFGREPRQSAITGGDTIATALERMISEYER